MSGEPLRARARTTLDVLRQELLGERAGAGHRTSTDDCNDNHRDSQPDNDQPDDEAGHWVGELSPSALSTATAISAMSAVLIHRTEATQNQDELRCKIACGLAYLRSQQNDDGGFGDTDRSLSNIATSYLALAAASLADVAVGQSMSVHQRKRLETYVRDHGEIEGLRQRYGTDKTFVVPILANMAIAGLVPWDLVQRLPFEVAVFPQSMYRWLQMPVVSYAIPALVAIGQSRHFHGRPVFWPWKMVRAASVGRSMNVLRRMQPDSGGFLEATPLTAFVVMNLAVTMRGSHDVSLRGLRFLCDSMNADGSWPIDTNLATWVTSLAIDALSSDPDDDGAWCSQRLIDWHLGCQHQRRHPFTGAEPGGWGWSDLSGAVPDSDDTPAAILAIEKMRRWMSADSRQASDKAAASGAEWLRRLQNRDGGWPTFCRGWGKLPFDRSSNDLTAHALRALHAAARLPLDSRLDGLGYDKAAKFLEHHQEEDGSWLPLWFGNQDRDDESNPVYGTARVLLAGATGALSPESQWRGCEYLVRSQNPDGGWGGGPSMSKWLGAEHAVTSSVEETAVAVEALIAVESMHAISAAPRPAAPHTAPIHPSLTSIHQGDGNSTLGPTIIRGIEFLLDAVDDGRHHLAWPIGFYFAKLWYHERLYPLIFTTSTLGKYLRWEAEQASEPPHETNDYTSDD